MSEETFKYQLSVKLPVDRDNRGYRDDMLNIRANSYDEFLSSLNEFLDEPQGDIVAAIAQVEASVKAASVAAVGLSVQPTTVQVAAGKPDEAQQQTTGDPVPDPYKAAFEGKSRTCNHGARVFVEGANWKALMCPTEKGTVGQCSPEWADRKKL